METYQNTLTIKTSNNNKTLSFKDQQKLEQVSLYLNNIKDFDQYISDHEGEIPLKNEEDKDIANEIKFTSTPPVNGTFGSALWKGSVKASWMSESILNCSLWFVIVLSKKFPDLIFEYPIMTGGDQLIEMKIQNAVKHKDDKLMNCDVLIIDRLVRYNSLLNMEYRDLMELDYENGRVEVEYLDIVDEEIEVDGDVKITDVEYSIAFSCDPSPIYTIRKYEHINGTLLKFEWIDYTDADGNLFPDENKHFRSMLATIGYPDAPSWHITVNLKNLLTKAEGKFQFYPDADSS